MPPIDRQAAFSGTRPVAQAHRFEVVRLERWLSDHVDGFRGPVDISQFRGGQSNPTYKVTAASGTYVIRRKPPGKLLPSAHAVDREFRVISALHAQGFPVARPLALCEDESVIGTMFYVMDYIDGRIFWLPHLPDLDRQERSAIYDSMNETIAQLHSIDYEAAGLAGFGKPDGYVARQIRRWSEQYRLSETVTIPEMNRLMDWLPDACPPQSLNSLVHGDFRLDNLIIHPRQPRVVAVLDWELATLGDPIGDFTYHLMQWHMPPSPTGAGTGSLLGFDLPSLGIPTQDDYIARYTERTGFVIENLDFYFAYNFFRLAAILQGIAGRVRDGTATNPNAAAMADQVLPLARTAWAYAERAGAA